MEPRGTRPKPVLDPVSIPAEIPPPLGRLIQRAVMEGATDIHVDTWAGGGAVRFRVDGVVHLKDELGENEAQRLVNQVKVAAAMEYDEPHEPMEGQFRWRTPEDEGVRAPHDERDVRATVVPRRSGGAAHMRLLVPPRGGRDIREIGLDEEDRQLVERVVHRPHGLVLIAGPTGSGKTTTLYALATMQDLRERVAVAIEDPPEFELPYLRQIEVDEDRGVTMESALRAMLRMDPDMIVIGEIRDRASATTAGHAALAGRQVLATIHARDAAAAVEALHYLSVPYYILGSALRLIVAQNLVRRLCKGCAEPRPLRDAERRLFEHVAIQPPGQVFEPGACEACHGYGYRGQTGVFEVVGIDDELGAWLSQGHRQSEIRERFHASGARPFVADALEKVRDGVTSLREVAGFFGRHIDRAPVLGPEDAEL